MNWNIVSYVHWLLRYRWPVILMTLALAALAGSGVRFLTVDTDYRVFFDEENPYLTAFDRLERTYSKLDTVLFVVKPADDDVFTAKTLSALKQLTDAAWQIPHSTRVDSITNFQHTRADGDDLIVHDLVSDTAALDDSAVAQIRAVALTEPALARRLVAADAGAAGVVVTIQAPEELQFAEQAVIEHAREIVAEILAAEPDIEIRMTGNVTMAHAFFATVARDLSTLTPMMLVFLTLTLALVTRSASVALAGIIVVLLSAATGLGLGGWFGYDVSGPGSASPTLILTVAIADAIHVLISMRILMRRGVSKQDAIAESLRINWQPVFLTSLTTAIGFLCLNFADAPPFHALGTMAAMGAIAAWIYSVVLLPALLSILPFSIKQSTRQSRWSMEALAEFVIARRSMLLPGMSIIVLICLGSMARLEIDDDIGTYLAKGTEFRDANDFAIEHLSGNYTLEYSLSSGEPHGISGPAYLRNLDKFSRWLRSQPQVIHVASFSDVMRRLNRNMHGDDDEWYRLPVSRELAAQYLLLYEFSLPYGLDLNNQIDIEKSATRLTVTMRRISTVDTRDFLNRIDTWMHANLPPVMHASAASPHVMFSFIFFENIRSMLLGTAIAFAAISLLLALALRSWKMGLLSFAPNLAPAFMAFGVYAVFESNVGLPAAMVTVTALGLIVDATVHFLSKYLRARREEGVSSEDAIRYAFATVGTALWICSTVLIVGFSILRMSTFKINATLGTLVALTVGLALIVDFLLLPALLMAVDKGSHAIIGSPSQPN